MTDFQKQSIDHAAGKLREAKSRLESVKGSLQYNEAEQARHQAEIDKLEAHGKQLEKQHAKASSDVADALSLYQNVCADFAGVSVPKPEPKPSNLFGFPINLGPFRSILD